MALTRILRTITECDNCGKVEISEEIANAKPSWNEKTTVVSVPAWTPDNRWMAIATSKGWQIYCSPECVVKGTNNEAAKKSS